MFRFAETFVFRSEIAEDIVQEVFIKLWESPEIKIEKKEVWHDEKNAEEMRSHQEVIIAACGGDLGVPCFLSKKKNKALCGEVSYKELREWTVKNS